MVIGNKAKRITWFIIGRFLPEMDNTQSTLNHYYQKSNHICPRKAYINYIVIRQICLFRPRKRRILL